MPPSTPFPDGRFATNIRGFLSNSRSCAPAHRGRDVAELAQTIAAAIFAFSSLYKARNRDVAVTAAVNLGAPQALAPGIVNAVIGLEAILAVSLLTSLAQYGATVGMVLVTGLSAVVATNLARGNRPPCACFGAASQRPISSTTLLRNGLILLVLVAAATFTPRGTPPTHLIRSIQDAPRVWLISIVGTVFAGNLVALWIVLLATLRRYGQLLANTLPTHDNGKHDFLTSERSLPGAALSQRMLAASLVSGSNREVSVRSWISESNGPVVAVFLSDGCHPCSELVQQLRESELSRTEGRVAIWMRRGAAKGFDLDELLGITDGLASVAYTEAAQELGIGGTPAAIAFSGEARVLSRVRYGVVPILELLQETIGLCSEGFSAPRENVQGSA